MSTNEQKQYTDLPLIDSVHQKAYFAEFPAPHKRKVAGCCVPQRYRVVTAVLLFLKTLHVLLPLSWPFETARYRQIAMSVTYAFFLPIAHQTVANSIVINASSSWVMLVRQTFETCDLGQILFQLENLMRFHKLRSSTWIPFQKRNYICIQHYTASSSMHVS